MASAAQLERRNRVHGSSFTPQDLNLPASSCPLCGSQQTAQAFKDNACSLRVCELCDLFFVEPYPVAAGQHQRVASGHNPEIQMLDCARRYSGEQLYYHRHFSGIADECRGASSLLDVGCGTGHLLERLAADQPSMKRTGIELNAAAAQFARRIATCEILETPIEQFAGREQFDVITLVNVFSHIPSFDRLFTSLRKALAPGGKIVLRTTEMTRNVKRWNQVHWGIPDDLHFLGMRTLDFLCAKYGFVVTRHVRTAFEDELFLPSRWRQMGRSKFQNRVKRAVLATPFALRALKAAYSRTLGKRLFISFVVITPLKAR